MAANRDRHCSSITVWKKNWPGITLGVIFGYLFNNNALNASIGLAIGNTLEALIAVYLLRKYMDFHNSLDRIQDVIRVEWKPPAGGDNEMIDLLDQLL